MFEKVTNILGDKISKENLVYCFFSEIEYQLKDKMYFHQYLSCQSDNIYPVSLRVSQSISILSVKLTNLYFMHPVSMQNAHWILKKALQSYKTSCISTLLGYIVYCILHFDLHYHWLYITSYIAHIYIYILYHTLLYILHQIFWFLLSIILNYILSYIRSI